MRSITSVTASTGTPSSRWVTVDSMQPPFSVGLGLSISSGTPTYTVQHTFDPTDGPTHDVTIACTASTTVTVTDTAHGLSTGDSVTITGSGNSAIDGSFDVTVTNANTYTYTTTSTTYNGLAECLSFRVYPHAVLVSQTARADGNYAFPIYACRVKITVGTGTVSMTVMQGTGI